MFRQSNLKILLAILVVLGGIFAFIQYRKSQQGERTFPEKVVDLEKKDTSDITGIEIIPEKNDENKLMLSKTNGSWVVTKGDKEYRAHKPVIERMVNQLTGMDIRNVVGMDASTWKAYQVTDSLGTEVRVLKDGKVIQNFVVGKFKYVKPSGNNQRQMMMRRRRPRGTMISYVRRAEDENVYTVEGYLKNQYTNRIEAYRDKTIINADPGKWNKLTFSYPADSSFTLEKKKGQWMINGEKPVDSINVSRYFNKIKNVNGSKFLDEDKASSAKVTHSLKIEGTNMDESLKVTAAPMDTTNQNFFVQSSMNEEAAFSGKRGNVFDRIFVSQEAFFGKPEKKTSRRRRPSGQPQINKSQLKQQIQRQ